MFNYGSFKLLLLKVFVGAFLLGFSLFLFVSIYTYNPNDPGIGRLVVNLEIKNFFGFWGAVFSIVFLMLFGKASFFLLIFLLLFIIILIIIIILLLINYLLINNLLIFLLIILLPQLLF